MVGWRLILVLMSAVTIQVLSQLDSHGFLSIDSGLPTNSTYVEINGLTYVSDDKFIKTGVISNISSSIIAQLGNNVFREFLTVRYFPTGVRNCYAIRSLTAGFKYLLRTTFFYGNYDELWKFPIFDIYLGTIFWNTVNTSSLNFPEIIFTATADYLYVCLINKGQGIPFISSLHLRKLETGMYPYANSTSSLILVWRANLGGGISTTMYPLDIYDRWWYNGTFDDAWTEISTNSNISYSEPDFEVPSYVMRTAVTTSNVRVPLVINWKTEEKNKYYCILYFYEIQTQLSGSREFDVFFNGTQASTEPILKSGAYITNWWFGSPGNYSVSLEATSNSTLPPLLNAFELYTIAPDAAVFTYAEDVAAINSIKEYHKINKEWSGDPCFPAQFLWTGINCNTDFSNITRIKSLDLSSSFLNGPLCESFGNLTALQYLYLSDNNLTGSLPSSLDNLEALILLDIRGNPYISTILPPKLETKRQNGFLIYRHGETSPPPPAPRSPPPPKNRNIIIIAIAVGVLLLIITIAIAVFGFKKTSTYKPCNAQKQNENHEPRPLRVDIHAKSNENTPQAEHPNWKSESKRAEDMFPKLEIHNFTYSDIIKITNDLENKIGRGGFGIVYLGHLENGVQVAVKILSGSSTQTVRQFRAEAGNLARLHHKNLVSLLGYCMDKDCMALVCEYMQQGNLHDKLNDNLEPLSWKQRLQIAYESAQGNISLIVGPKLVSFYKIQNDHSKDKWIILPNIENVMSLLKYCIITNTNQNKLNEGLEYLHDGCNPPVIHRDVKIHNILLNANLEAKIADFGLSRAFENAISHVSTIVAGTPGYLAPECYLSNHLSAKSDVFSFGVVLLEIITGQPPTGMGIEGGNLVQWVHCKLSGGDIESIVDPRIQDKYDINSVWKVVDLAHRCTENTADKRPTMSEVVAELKESLDLEMSMEELCIGRTDNSPTNASQKSTFEIYVGEIPMTDPNLR